ncbi:hypothetical protein D3X11_01440 [Streptococcus sp. X16XC17]|uniref:hypothetical protein n=1 Tax=unclassified Streptococcus TaxID=2608887 RepID=UPI00066FD1D5|nr:MULTISPECIES: hypothetical protein [unclassified Streptococcus]TCD46150.1 hypothetical protein D3X11_01440 [Streptococcus sp. X16XC17]
MMQAIEQFYGEKSDYITYKKTGVLKGQIGHYESMINPEYHHIGMGTFIGNSQYYRSSAQAFSLKTGLNESATGQYGLVSQTIEVQSNRLRDTKIDLKTPTIGVGTTQVAQFSYQYNH